ncbi:MAG: MFS transporter [Gammaproteobacteria bacterium]|nr:MFS transporter [Gammaproteobacteria bacterium]
MSTNQRLLFALLCGVVLFEGFDTNVAGIVLPYVGREFGAGSRALGSALSIIGLGAVLAFFTIRLGDRFGRRPVILGAVLGFGLFTFASAFVRSIDQFIVLQLCARVCLVTQLSTAYILLNEFLAADVRGRASGVMGAAASLGAALPAMLLQPAVDSGHGWRALFVIGALPLLLLPGLWRVLHESETWLAARGGADGMSGAAPPHTLLAQLRAVLTPQLRRRFIAISALWFLITFWSATLFFFTYYAFEERGWTPRHLQVIALPALMSAVLGYSAAGWLMDRIGRRPATVLMLCLATTATVLCFRATGTWAVGTGWLLLQLALGIWAIGHVMTTELFPTEVRAAAYGLAHNLIGRWGFVAGPAAVGWLAGPLSGASYAIVALSVVNLLAIPLVLWVLPETRYVDLAQR